MHQGLNNHSWLKKESIHHNADSPNNPYVEALARRNRKDHNPARIVSGGDEWRSPLMLFFEAARAESSQQVYSADEIRLV